MIQQPIVKVAMADLGVAVRGECIRTTGLGSCVGLTLYDAVRKIGGMAHVMLPDSSIAREFPFNRAKYADTAVPLLIEELEKAGARVERMNAKMAGGAQMFASLAQSDSLRIGPRNVESCALLLSRIGIPVVAEDTGGNYGRTIELDSETGILTIRSAQNGTKEL
ncbi:chemotaxis protein CheD [Paenibacillus pasadenensis]|uniref:Probable chemoreceptor glutamine deamidase CheD n=1 Tax=Paenibacillus pasadenensis TaxID=217090 RepID=A0A2N5N741_9BACL|nr:MULTISPECIES: chemotaxis protein CheD [Paenibacillus]PLT46176.1 Chemotaxis protein CheD [Paenibacillus pasadenensis]QGG56638.1 chemotaxis protein CheD [Paenibacillus sp. B01]